jgi:adenylate kinase
MAGRSCLMPVSRSGFLAHRPSSGTSRGPAGLYQRRCSASASAPGVIAVRAAGDGYVFDGVPRTIAQARAAYKMALELGMSANAAVHLRADDNELARRLLGRAALEHRSDDTEEVIRHRLELYRQVTQPIIAWYAQRGILVSVDAMRPVGEVGREILAALELMRPPAGHIPAGMRRPVDLSGLGARCGDA